MESARFGPAKRKVDRDGGAVGFGFALDGSGVESTYTEFTVYPTMARNGVARRFTLHIWQRRKYVRYHPSRDAVFGRTKSGNTLFLLSFLKEQTV